MKMAVKLISLFGGALYIFKICTIQLALIIEGATEKVYQWNNT
jgi:hypothetical protein